LAALIDAELSVLPAVGHYAHLEAPHAVADAIAGFAGPSR
jgi:pimeloyl-ACP methyl ester carboxylesterase